MLTISRAEFTWPAASSHCISIDALSVPPGATLFLQGPSGSGKSTLLGLLAGVLLPQKGLVALNGVAWKDLPALRRDTFRAEHVGYIFQQFNLVPYLTARDNVLLPCRFSKARAARAGTSRASINGEAERLLAHMELPQSAWDRPSAELSVGQQQRVAAARALIGHPGVIIADEPTSALDLSVRDRFMDLLIGQCRVSNSAVVFVSHDDRLASFFDRTISLKDINKEPGECLEENA